MSKISAEHLSRSAYVYIRQSTADQLHHHHESRRRQYALAERARALGWSDGSSSSFLGIPLINHINAEISPNM